MSNGFTIIWLLDQFRWSSCSKLDISQTSIIHHPPQCVASSWPSPPSHVNKGRRGLTHLFGGLGGLWLIHLQSMPKLVPRFVVTALFMCVLTRESPLESFKKDTSHACREDWIHAPLPQPLLRSLRDLHLLATTVTMCLLHDVLVLLAILLYLIVSYYILLYCSPSSLALLGTNCQFLKSVGFNLDQLWERKAAYTHVCYHQTSIKTGAGVLHENKRTQYYVVS